MGRKAHKPKGKSIRMHIVIPSELVLKIDKRVEDLKAAAPGSTVTRTEVARRAIYQYLEE